MTRSALAADADFSEAVLRGLADLGHVDIQAGDLTLELGLSVWMRECGTDLEGARATMLFLKRALLEASEMDPRIEPIPLRGRSTGQDLVQLASYLSELTVRAAAVAKCGHQEIVERTVVRATTEIAASGSPAASLTSCSGARNHLSTQRASNRYCRQRSE